MTPKALQRSVARALKSNREAAGLTQANVARKLKMARSNLCAIENGRRQASICTLARIANAIGCVVHVHLLLKKEEK